MNSNNNLLNAGLAIVFIAILGWVVIFLFSEIGRAPWQFITILIAFLGGLITLAGNLQLQIRNEQREKKIEIYEEVIQFFFEVVFATKLGHESKSEEELVDFFQRIIPKLVLWASDDVLATFIKFRQLSNQSGGTSAFSLFGKLLLDIRKDLGHQNKSLDELYLLGVFVNDIENLSQ
jgi:hypothetical protein